MAGKTGFQVDGIPFESSHASQINPDVIHIQWDDAGKQLLACVNKSLRHPSKKQG